MKKLKNFWSVNLAILILGILIAIPGVPAQNSILSEKTPKNQEKFIKTEDAIPNQYIVVFEDKDTLIETLNSSDAIKLFAETLAAQHNGKIDYVYDSALKGFSVKMTEREALLLSKDARVKYVVQDGMAYPTTTQNNPPSWGLDRIDQQYLPYNGKYNYSANGNGVRAYVIDSGVLPSHVEFGGRASVGADFVGGNGIDCNGHGTHVAGTIAGSSVGVAKGASVIGVRVFGCSGGSGWSTIIAGVDWVRTNGVRPAVVNMSLGGGANQAIDDAVRNLINSGVTVVVAAGNNNQDANGYSPARTREAITVGSTDINDRRSSFSNFGSAVDLFAPGSSIYSAWFNGGYNTISGTSMATPHVAGAVATYLSVNPGASPATVRNVIVGYSAKNVVSDPGSGSPNALLFSGVYNSCGVLYSGQALFKGQSVTACNGAITLVFQGDGNVVLYKNTGANAGRALWHSQTNGSDAYLLIMQTDGNLVLYKSGAVAVWNTNTYGNPDSFLAVQNDSNLVIYKPPLSAIWSTGTYGQ